MIYMEDIMVNSIQMLVSYGALGVCCIYFMVRDWMSSKKDQEREERLASVIEKNTDTISDFTVALKVLTSQGK